jgi:hypothetical protein
LPYQGENLVVSKFMSLNGMRIAVQMEHAFHHVPLFVRRAARFAGLEHGCIVLPFGLAGQGGRSAFGRFACKELQPNIEGTEEPLIRAQNRNIGVQVREVYDAVSTYYA